MSEQRDPLDLDADAENILYVLKFGGAELVPRLRSSDPEQLRRFAYECACLALGQAGVDEHLVADVLPVARALAYDSVAPEAQVKARLQVIEIVRRLDEEGFTLNERGDGHADAPDYPRYVEVYQRARAVDALSGSLIRNPLLAAADSAYQAFAGVKVPLTELLALADRILG